MTREGCNAHNEERHKNPEAAGCAEAYPDGYAEGCVQSLHVGLVEGVNSKI